MSKEFSWTPDEIRDLTLQDFGYYCDRFNRDRDTIAPIDVALEDIKQLLIAGFGIKIKKQVKQKDEIEQFKKTGLGTFSFTTEEKKAWLDAKMPNPTKFLREYRKKHGD